MPYKPSRTKTPEEIRQYNRAWSMAKRDRDNPGRIRRGPRGCNDGISKAEIYARSNHSRRLKKRGLSEEDYQSMLAVVPGCAICGKLPTQNRRLAIDHDHKTGRVRGLLCWDCNGSIGKFRDDAGLLQSAIDYLT